MLVSNTAFAAIDLTPEEKDWIEKNPIVEVGADQNWPPFDFIAENGQYQGIASDYITELSEITGLTFSVRGDIWKNVMADIKSGKLDMLACAANTPERRTYLNFTDPYISIDTVIVVRKEQPTYHSLAELNGKTVALPKGTYINEFLETHYPKIKLNFVKSNQEAIHTVSVGKADAYVGNLAVVSYFMELDLLTNLKIVARVPQEKNRLSMAVRQDKPLLHSILQKGLAQIEEERRREIFRTWINIELAVPETLRIKLTSKEKKWIEEHPFITIGVDGQWPPIDYIDKENNHRGIAADYIEIISKRLGIQFEVEKGPSFKEMLEKVQDGRLKIGTSIVKTEERSKSLNFTQPFFTVHKAIVTRKDVNNITTLADLVGKTVAIENGYTTMKDLERDHPEINLKIVNSTLEALEDVAWGRADAYIGTRPVTQWIIQKNQLLNLKFTGNPGFKAAAQRFAISKDPEWQPLINLINKVLQSITADEHRQLHARWLNPEEEDKPIQRITLTKQEQDWLLKHPEIRLGVDPAWPPIEFVNDKGYYQGIASEYITYISQQLDVLMKPVPGLNWEEVIQKVKKKEIDVLPAVASSEERAKYLNFTKPYLSFPFVIFLRDDSPFITSIDDIKGQRIAVEKSYITEEYLRRDYPELNLYLVNSSREGLEAVSLGHADAYIGNLATGSYIIEYYGLANLKVAAPTPYKFDLRFAVRKDWPELIPILEKALKDIPTEKHAEIRKKWFAVSYEKAIDYSLVWKIIIIATVIFIFGMLWFRHICRQREALRLIEERFNLAMDASSEGIWDWQVDKDIVSYSDNYLNMLGYSNEDFPDQKDIWRKLIHPDDLEPTYKEMRKKMLQTNLVRFDTEFRMKHKNGTYRYIHSVGSVIERNKRNWPIRIIGSQRDITEKKKAEQRLAIFHRFAEAVNQGFAIATMDSKIIYSNSRLCYFVCNEYKDNMLGESLFDYFTEDSEGQIRNDIMPTFIDKSEWFGELKIISKQGHIIPVLVSMILIRDEWGTPQHYGIIITDISEQKRFEAELKMAKEEADQANRFKSDFLANMSHEIRTPMNAIVGMSHLAQQTKLTEKQRKYLDTIQLSCQTLLAIINDILDFSKIEADKLDLESIDFNLNDVMNHIGDMFCFTAEEKNIELLFNIDPSVPNKLIGDPLRLGQILTNLTSNAFKFTKHGNIIILVENMKVNNERVILKFSVKDTGIGLSHDQKENLFNPFFQADSSTTRQFGGTGLGLAICKRLVEMMDGNISLDSKLDEGSTFYFTAEFGLQHEELITDPYLHTDLRGLVALVVDDNKMAREIISNMLISFSFDVTSVDNGQSALQILETDGQKFDLLIIDWKMPGVDGLETARLIRQSKLIKKQPAIIMITSQDKEALIDGCSILNITELISKPVSPSTLFDSVISAIKPDYSKSGHTRPELKTDSSLAGKILLVEDNCINQQVACELLELFGLSVTIVSDGKEAIQKVQSDTYDIVLMDIQMPDMDGFETTKIIRNIPELKSLPIIAMTAHAMSGDKEKSLAAGMNDHITKPIDPDVLQQTLRDWLNIDMIKKITINHGENEIEFPDQPDILDISLGLKHVIGNKRLLKKLLIEFHQDHKDDVSTLSTLLETGEIEKAERLLHTLKGISANIGAHKLFDKVSVLEKNVSDGSISSDEDFAKFKDAFSELMSLLEKL